MSGVRVHSRVGKVEEKGKGCKNKDLLGLCVSNNSVVSGNILVSFIKF